MIRTHINKHHLALIFRKGDLHRVLRPGTHWTPGRLFRGDTIRTIDTFDRRFTHKQFDVLVEDPRLRSELDVIDLREDERALVWIGSRLEAILEAGRYAYWKSAETGDQPIHIERHAVTEGPFEHPRMDAILAHQSAPNLLRAVRASFHETVLFFLDGARVHSMTSGIAIFWKTQAELTWKSVDLREQAVDINGQEIMTADKVSLRVNMLVTYSIADAEAAVSQVDNLQGALYRESQLALRAALGGRTLDQLLADKETVGEELATKIGERVSDFGVEIKGTGLRDLILPGEMKTIFNQVIEAQKRAESNLIRRREETAAARSQANTARLLAENPALARMKELEAVQEILAGTKATFLFGGGDLLSQVKGLTGSDPTSHESESG